MYVGDTYVIKEYIQKKFYVLRGYLRTDRIPTNGKFQTASSVIFVKISYHPILFHLFPTFCVGYHTATYCPVLPRTILPPHILYFCVTPPMVLLFCVDSHSNLLFLVRPIE